MAGKAESRWHRFGERYGNRCIVSKITSTANVGTMYLVLCQCGNLVATTLSNVQKSQDKSFCADCTNGFDQRKMPSDKSIYDIFFKLKEEEK